MNTLEISEIRGMSPSVRDISRYRRLQSTHGVEAPFRRKSNPIQKAKFFGIVVFASFMLLTFASEGVRTWLRHSASAAETSGTFMVPANSFAPVRVNQPVLYQARPADQAGLVREANRYRVDMTRERNRFISSLLGSAERLTSRLNR